MAKCKRDGELHGGQFDKYIEEHRRVYSPDGSAPTIHTAGGGGQELKIAEVVGGIGEKKSNGGTQFYQQDRVYEGDVALSQPANLPGGSYNYLLAIPEATKEGQTLKTDPQQGCVVNKRIRKLTEKECFRLMGVNDADFDAISARQSSTSLYHLAGDSIVTTVLMALFASMLCMDAGEKIKEVVEDITQEETDERSV